MPLREFGNLILFNLINFLLCYKYRSVSSTAQPLSKNKNAKSIHFYKITILTVEQYSVFN